MPDCLWFHVVTTGSARLEVDDAGAADTLRPGELALVPHGTGHRLTDAAGTHAPSVLGIPARVRHRPLRDHPARRRRDGDHAGLRRGPVRPPRGPLAGRAAAGHRPPHRNRGRDRLGLAAGHPADDGRRGRPAPPRWRDGAHPAGRRAGHPGHPGLVGRRSRRPHRLARRATGPADRPRAGSGAPGSGPGLDGGHAGRRVRDVPLGVRRPVHRAGRRTGHAVRDPVADAGRGARAEHRSPHRRRAGRAARLPVRGSVQPGVQAGGRGAAGGGPPPAGVGRRRVGGVTRRRRTVTGTRSPGRGAGGATRRSRRHGRPFSGPEGRAGAPEVPYVLTRISDGRVTKRTPDSPADRAPQRMSSPAVDPEGRSWLGIAPPGAAAHTRARDSWPSAAPWRATSCAASPPSRPRFGGARPSSPSPAARSPWPAWPRPSPRRSTHGSSRRPRCCRPARPQHRRPGRPRTRSRRTADRPERRPGTGVRRPAPPSSWTPRSWSRPFSWPNGRPRGHPHRTDNRTRTGRTSERGHVGRRDECEGRQAGQALVERIHQLRAQHLPARRGQVARAFGGQLPRLPVRQADRARRGRPGRHLGPPVRQGVGFHGRPVHRERAGRLRAAQPGGARRLLRHLAAADQLRQRLEGDGGPREPHREPHGPRARLVRVRGRRPTADLLSRVATRRNETRRSGHVFLSSPAVARYGRARSAAAPPDHPIHVGPPSRRPPGRVIGTGRT